jgi:fucose permease
VPTNTLAHVQTPPLASLVIPRRQRASNRARGGLLQQERFNRSNSTKACSRKVVHTAAALVSVAPLLVIFGTLFLIDEKKASMNIQGMKHTFEGLSTVFRRRHLWIIAAFIFLYYFSPVGRNHRRKSGAKTYNCGATRLPDQRLPDRVRSHLSRRACGSEHLE